MDDARASFPNPQLQERKNTAGRAIKALLLSRTEPGGGANTILLHLERCLMHKLVLKTQTFAEHRARAHNAAYEHNALANGGINVAAK